MQPASRLLPPGSERLLSRRGLLGGAAAALAVAGTRRPAATAGTPVASYRVVATYPHDPAAFTQGLAWEDGQLWEGTGLVGQSEVSGSISKAAARWSGARSPPASSAKGSPSSATGSTS